MKFLTGDIEPFAVVADFGSCVNNECVYAPVYYFSYVFTQPVKPLGSFFNASKLPCNELCTYKWQARQAEGNPKNVVRSRYNNIFVLWCANTKTHPFWNILVEPAK